MGNIDRINDNRATRSVAAATGVLVGVAGIEHGILEVLQGNIETPGVQIDAIGPQQRMWEYAGEFALTLVPNFLATGILAILFGLLVTIWSLRFLDGKYGAPILLGLCIVLFLVGGGFAPILLSILAYATATQIHKPLRLWQMVMPGAVRRILARLWPWPVALFVLLFFFAVEIAIFGAPLTWFLDADTTYSVQFNLALISLGLIPFSILTGFAVDLELRPAEKKPT